MSRPLRHVWFVLLAMCIFIAGSGCALTRRDIGPLYKISRAERLQRESNALTVVKVRDRRPTWERKYHRPFIDPQRRRDGMELLTIDNFSPNPITQFQRHLTTRLASLEAPPESAEIIIKRFHVAVRYAAKATPARDSSISVTIPADQSQFQNIDPTVRTVEQENRYIARRKKWNEEVKVAEAAGKPSPRQPKLDDDDCDDDESIAGELLGTVIWVALELAVQSIFELPELMADTWQSARYAMDRGPPPAWAQIQPGITCQIQGDVHVRWADGREQTFPVDVQSTEQYEIQHDNQNYEVSAYLVEIMKQTAGDISQRAKQYLAEHSLAAK